jgi:hypothetical protein
MSLISAYSTNAATLTSNNTIYVNQIVPRQITINPVANGYSISIGCQTFVFESIVSMLSRIEEYYNDPAQVEQYFNEHKKLPNK